MAELKARADAGDKDAQHQLAEYLLHGNPGTADFDLALTWLRSAAEENPQARFLLGYFYNVGRGLGQDYSKAAQNYEAAALRGVSPAKNNHALLYQEGRGVQKDLTKAFELYRSAAQDGSTAGKYNLAMCYYQASGTTQNIAESLRWLRAAATEGHAAAEHFLAVLYAQGIGVPLDYLEAARWMLLSAQQGYPAAETDLACLYELGRGVPLDYVAAYAWYSRAIASGDRSGAARLRKLSEIMTAKQLKQASALFSSLAPGELTNPDASAATMLAQNPGH